MMIFKTTEHYPYFENEDICEKECIICYNSIPRNSVIKNIHNFNCECYKLIHEQCLQLWYDKNGTCPICRKRVYTNNQVNLFNVYKFLTALVVLSEQLFWAYVLYILIVISVNIIIVKLFH